MSSSSPPRIPLLSARINSDGVEQILFPLLDNRYAWVSKTACLRWFRRANQIANDMFKSIRTNDQEYVETEVNELDLVSQLSTMKDLMACVPDYVASYNRGEWKEETGDIENQIGTGMNEIFVHIHTTAKNKVQTSADNQLQAHLSPNPLSSSSSSTASSSSSSSSFSFTVSALPTNTHFQSLPQPLQSSRASVSTKIPPSKASPLPTDSSHTSPVDSSDVNTNNRPAPYEIDASRSHDDKEANLTFLIPGFWGHIDAREFYDGRLLLYRDDELYPRMIAPLVAIISQEERKQLIQQYYANQLVHTACSMGMQIQVKKFMNSRRLPLLPLIPLLDDLMARKVIKLSCGCMIWQFDFRVKLFWPISGVYGWLDLEVLCEGNVFVRFPPEEVSHVRLAVSLPFEKFPSALQECFEWQAAYEKGECKLAPSEEIRNRTTAWLKAKHLEKFNPRNLWNTFLQSSPRQVKPTFERPFSVQLLMETRVYMFFLLDGYCGLLDLDEIFDSHVSMVCSYNAYHEVVEAVVGTKEANRLTLLWHRGELIEVPRNVMLEKVNQVMTTKKLPKFKWNSSKDEANTFLSIRYVQTSDPEVLWVMKKQYAWVKLGAFFCCSYTSCALSFVNQMEAEKLMKRIILAIRHFPLGEDENREIQYDQNQCKEITSEEMKKHISQLVEQSDLVMLDFDILFNVNSHSKLSFPMSLPANLPLPPLYIFTCVSKGSQLWFVVIDKFVGFVNPAAFFRDIKPNHVILSEDWANFTIQLLAILAQAFPDLSQWEDRYLNRPHECEQVDSIRMVSAINRLFASKQMQKFSIKKKIKQCDYEIKSTSYVQRLQIKRRASINKPIHTSTSSIALDDSSSCASNSTTAAVAVAAEPLTTGTTQDESSLSPAVSSIPFKRTPQPYSLAARPAPLPFIYPMADVPLAPSSIAAPTPPLPPSHPMPFDHRQSNGGRAEIFIVTATQCGWIPIVSLFWSTPIGNVPFVSSLAPHVAQHMKSAFMAGGIAVPTDSYDPTKFVKQTGEVMIESAYSYMKEHAIALIDYPPFVMELASRKMIRIPFHSIVSTFDHRCMILWAIAKQYAFITIDDLFQHDQLIRLEDALWPKLLTAVLDAIRKAAGQEFSQWQQLYESGKSKPVTSTELVNKLNEWFNAKHVPKLTFNQLKNRLSEQIVREMKSPLPSLAPEPFSLHYLHSWNYAFFLVTSSDCGWVSLDSLLKQHLHSDACFEFNNAFAKLWKHQLKVRGHSNTLKNALESYSKGQLPESAMEQMPDSPPQIEVHAQSGPRYKFLFSVGEVASKMLKEIVARSDVSSDSLREPDSSTHAVPNASPSSSSSSAESHHEPSNKKKGQQKPTTPEQSVLKCAKDEQLPPQSVEIAIASASSSNQLHEPKAKDLTARRLKKAKTPTKVAIEEAHLQAPTSMTKADAASPMITEKSSMDELQNEPGVMGSASNGSPDSLNNKLQSSSSPQAIATANQLRSEAQKSIQLEPLDTASKSNSIPPVSRDTGPVIPNSCANCGSTKVSLSKCSACGTVVYCSRECQRSHWSHHKTECVHRNADAPLGTKPSNKVHSTSSASPILAVSIARSISYIAYGSVRSGTEFLEMYVPVTKYRGWCPLHELMVYVPLHPPHLVDNMKATAAVTFPPILKKLKGVKQENERIQMDDEKIITQVREWCNQGVIAKTSFALRMPLLCVQSRFDHRGEILWAVSDSVGFVEVEHFFQSCKPIRLNDHQLKEFAVAVADEVRKLAGNDFDRLQLAYRSHQCKLIQAPDMHAKVDSWFELKQVKKFDFDIFKAMLTPSLALAIDEATHVSSMYASRLAPTPYHVETDVNNLSSIFLLLPNVCGWVQVDCLFNPRGKSHASWIQPIAIRIMNQLLGEQLNDQLQVLYKQGKLKEIDRSEIDSRIIELMMLKNVGRVDLDAANSSKESTRVLSIRPPMYLYSLLVAPRGSAHIFLAVNRQCGMMPIEAVFKGMESKQILVDSPDALNSTARPLLDALWSAFQPELRQWEQLYKQGKCEEVNPEHMFRIVNQVFQTKKLNKFDLKQFVRRSVKYEIRDRDPTDQLMTNCDNMSSNVSQSSILSEFESSSSSLQPSLTVNKLVSMEIRDTAQGHCEILMHTTTHCGWVNLCSLFRGPIGIGSKDLRQIGDEASRKLAFALSTHDAGDISRLHAQGAPIQLDEQEMTIHLHQWLREKQISLLNFTEFLNPMIATYPPQSFPWPVTQVTEHRRCELMVLVDDMIGFVPIETVIQDCQFLRIDWSNLISNSKLIHAITSNIDQHALEGKKQKIGARVVRSEEMTIKLNSWFKSHKKQKLTLNQIKAKLTAQHAKAISEELTNSPFPASCSPKPFELVLVQGPPLSLEVFFFLPGYCGWIPIDWLFGDSKVEGIDSKTLEVRVTRILHLHYCVPFFGARSAIKARVNLYDGEYKEVSAADLRAVFESLLQQHDIKKAEFDQCTHDALNKLEFSIQEPILYSHSISSAGIPEIFVALQNECGWVPIKVFCSDAGWTARCFDMHNLNVVVNRVVFKLRNAFGKQLLQWEGQYERQLCKRVDSLVQRVNGLFQSKGVHKFDAKQIIEGLSLHKDADAIAKANFIIQAAVSDATSNSSLSQMFQIQKLDDDAPSSVNPGSSSSLVSTSNHEGLRNIHNTVEYIVNEYLESDHVAVMLSNLLSLMKSHGVESEKAKLIHLDALGFLTREFDKLKQDSTAVEYANALEKSGFVDYLLQFIGRVKGHFQSKGMIRALELLALVARINVGWRDLLLAKDVLRRLSKCEVNPCVYPSLFTRLMSSLIDKHNVAISEDDALLSLQSVVQLLTIEDDEIQLSAARSLEALLCIIHHHLSKPMDWHHRIQAMERLAPQDISEVLFPLIDPDRYYEAGSKNVTTFATNAFPVVFRSYSRVFRIILQLQSAMQSATLDLPPDPCDNVQLFANNLSDEALEGIQDHPILRQKHNPMLMKAPMLLPIIHRMTRLSSVPHVWHMQEEAEILPTTILTIRFLRFLEFLPYFIQPKLVPSSSMINSCLKALSKEQPKWMESETENSLLVLIQWFDSTHSTWKLLPATKYFLEHLASDENNPSAQALASQLIGKLKSVRKM